MIIYLDYNASTPVDPRVLETMVDIYKNHYGNADSRTHNHGLEARNFVERARKQIAELLEVEPNEVIFTSGATESANFAIKGLSQWGIDHNKKHIITTAIEHKAVLEPCKFLEKQGFEVDYVKPNLSGFVEVDAILSKIRPETLLISIQSANNETGVFQPIQEIGAVCKDKDIFFHVDAAQSFGKQVDELKNTYYNFLSITAHKIYGPQGIGALIARKKNYKKPPLQPQNLGGGQEDHMRGGTLPVALIAGFGKAVELASIHHSEWQKKYAQTKKRIMNAIEASGVRYQINGDQQHCLDNTLNVAFIGVNSEALMLSVKSGFSVSNGSACTSKDYKASYVLTSMGVPEDIAKSSIRLSWGKDMDEANIEEILKIVKAMG